VGKDVIGTVLFSLLVIALGSDQKWDFGLFSDPIVALHRQMINAVVPDLAS